jgi:hypothetical protein
VNTTSPSSAIVAIVAVVAIVLGLFLGVAEIRRHEGDRHDGDRHEGDPTDGGALPRSPRFSAAMLLVGMGTLGLGILLV